jgi:glycerophosphoryl diester phosphodiesterase
MSFFSLPKPRVFGHRGAAGLAPENTLPSFALANALGAAYLELDVHATLDGTVVVLHDPTLERTTNGCGPVAERGLAELQQLDAGYRFTTDGAHFPYRGQGVRIPTLEAVLRSFPQACFNIEIKQGDPPIVDRVIDLLEATGTLARTLLAAEQDSIMQMIRRLAGGRVATGMSAVDVAEFIDRCNRQSWEGYQPPGLAMQVPTSFGAIEIVNASTVRAAHRLGLEVHVWTINDAEEINRLLDLGVDGIMSDLPGLVVTASQRLAGRSR